MKDDLTARFMQLKSKKEGIEKSIMEANVRLESLQDQLKDAMKTLKESYNVDNLDDAKALLNEKDLEYNQIANALESKLKEYEDLID